MLRSERGYQKQYFRKNYLLFWESFLPAFNSALPPKA